MESETIKLAFECNEALQSVIFAHPVQPETIARCEEVCRKWKAHGARLAEHLRTHPALDGMALSHEEAAKKLATAASLDRALFDHLKESAIFETVDRMIESTLREKMSSGGDVGAKT